MRSPGHGTVVAYLALFVALGGGAFAATTAERNSVDSRAIRNGQVKRVDIARGAVDARRLAPRAVRRSKLANRAVGTSKLADGAVNRAKLGARSVGAAQLATDAVTGDALAPDAVSGPAVANGSLTGADIDEATLGTVPSAALAADAGTLGGLGPDQFLQGAGTTLAARGLLQLGGGGLQLVLSVPGVGDVVGGCGSGGGGVGFVNRSGGALSVHPFAGGDLTPVTVADGASSGLFPAGVGSAGFTFLQVGSIDTADQRLVTVIASRGAQAASKCSVQAWATRLN